MNNVLITGGTKGIGEACARLFVKNNYRVFIIYRSDDKKAELLKSEIGCCAYKADICRNNEIADIIEDIYRKYGSIDVLINNAGIAQQKLFSDITEKEWNRMIDVNLNGIYNVTNAVLKKMIKENKGVIVNVSSIWGQCGASCEVHYSAAKAGIIGFTKALAKEMGLSGIRINCVAPGMIDTPMNAGFSDDDKEIICSEIPLGRMGTPEECAELIYFLSSEDSSYITGQVIGINGGWHI